LGLVLSVVVFAYRRVGGVKVIVPNAYPKGIKDYSTGKGYLFNILETIRKFLVNKQLAISHYVCRRKMKK
jgi:hypothetical protein